MDNYSEDLYKNKELSIEKTSIPGLLKINLVVNGDSRGWFKESFQKEKLLALGFPADFNPIQNNISSNKEMGVTRGVHAEPWNKYITLSRGRAFAAIVDLREGDTFGKVESFSLDPSTALFVPKGCGNSYQSLSDNVEYCYLVDAHWSPASTYVSVNIADEDLAIAWPIPLNEAIISDKDKASPLLKDIVPYKF